MARSVNKVVLLGNLGNDPEIRTFPSGGQVANLSIATSISYRDQNSGEMIDKTEWHRVNVFNKLADVCKNYLRKGSRVYIEGSLQTRSWEQDGQKRYSTEVVCRELMMLDDRNSDQRATNNFNTSSPTKDPVSEKNLPHVDVDDEIPF